MNSDLTLTVPFSSQVLRLDRFLTLSAPNYSRSYFQELIRGGNIGIDGKVATKPAQVLKEDQVVTCSFPPLKAYNVQPQKIDFEIVDTKPDFIIVNKPAGLLVHQATTAALEEPTLVAGLLYHFNELEEFSDRQRPGIVHRLDKNTSGLLIVARSISAHGALSALFKQRSIQKTYLALLEGHPPKEGKIEYPIGRDPHNPVKMSHKGIASRPAISYYQVLASYPHHSLVAIRIITGRTHQIRVHCAAIGHSVVGDEIYGKRSSFIKRQALHAWKLAFEYQGKEQFYTCAIPDDFSHLIKAVAKKS